MSSMFVRFLMVGGTTTLIHYLILFILVRMAGVNEVTASTVGFVSSAVLNYWFNRSFTFQSNRRHTQALPRFILVALIGMLINAFVVWVAVLVLAFNLILGQLLATGCAMVWSFIANKLWAFSNPAP